MPGLRHHLQQRGDGRVLGERRRDRRGNPGLLVEIELFDSSGELRALRVHALDPV